MNVSTSALVIREASSRDLEAIRALHLSAFPEGERELVSRVAVELLSEDTMPRTLSLVAQIGDRPVGHVAFSPVSVGDRSGSAAYILAPLAVRPEVQGLGVGTRLVEQGMRQLTSSGVTIVLVYGDPGYYGRFGFSADAATAFLPPYELEYAFGWQAAIFDDRQTGRIPARISCVAALSDPKLW